MQAEILHLENELKNIELEDSRSKEMSRSMLHASLFNLKRSSDGCHDTQWRKVLEIREKLKCYNNALVLFSHVQGLPVPCMRDIKTLQEWLDRPEGGDFFLQGREADTWNDQDDVLTLSRSQADRDWLTGFLNDFVVPWYHLYSSRWSKVCPLISDLIRQTPSNTVRKCPRSGESNGVWHYRYEPLVALVNGISTLLSSLLPSASIFTLYFLQRPIARLAAIMVFSTLFSLTLSVMTKARRVDVFAATTASVSSCRILLLPLMIAYLLASLRSRPSL
ncbi:MAG: hypothetical protein Q9184_004894 [Pyrenodesmia sp. 2 TL-2023]